MSEELLKSMPPRPSLAVVEGAAVVPRVKLKAFCPSPTRNPKRISALKMLIIKTYFKLKAQIILFAVSVSIYYIWIKKICKINREENRLHEVSHNCMQVLCNFLTLLGS